MMLPDTGAMMRMEYFDALSRELRDLANEFGLTLVAGLHEAGQSVEFIREHLTMMRALPPVLTLFPAA